MIVNRQDRPTGRLAFDSGTLEFGEIPAWKSEPVTKVIKGRNIGRKKLVIRRVDSSCGYSVIQYPEQLAPGEIGTFTIKANPAKARSKGSVHIVTDSLQEPHIYLSVLAVIKPYAEFSHPICDFGEIYTNTVHEKSIRLSINAPVEPKAVQLAPAQSDVVKCKIERVGSSEFELKIKLGPIDTERFFSTVLTVILPDYRTIILPVIAQVVGRVQVSPEVLFYKTVAKAENPVTDFTLRSEMPFKVLKIDSPKALAIKIKDPPNTYQTSMTVQVRLYPEKVKEILRGEIRVFTNAEQHPIRIPVYAVIEDSLKVLSGESGEKKVQTVQ